MNINSPALLGALRGLGMVVVIAILSYVGDATNIAFIDNPVVESIIVTVALAIEHAIEAKKGKALFGAVKTK